MDLRGRAARVVAYAVELSSADSAQALVASLTAENTPRSVAFWVERGSPDAIRILARSGDGRTLPTIVGANWGGVRVDADDDTLLTQEDTSTTGALDDLRLDAQGLAARASRLGVTLAGISSAPFADTAVVSGALYASAHYRERLADVVGTAIDAGLAVGLWLVDASQSLAAESTWDLARLQAIELPILDEAIEAGVEAILLPPILLPAITGDTLPVSISPAAIRGLLRRDRGWNGLVIADLRAPVGGARLAPLALAAGADLVITRDPPAIVIDSVVAAVAAGKLSPARLEQAVQRVLRHQVRAREAMRISSADSLGPVDAPANDPSALAHPTPATPDSLSFFSLAEPEVVGMSAEGLLDADRAILEAIQDSVFTAAALAVGRHGRLVRLVGYGETVSGTAVDAERTLFDIASLTKVVATTTAAAILVDEGELGFDDPVREHLREFRGEHKGEVTIRHLLSHTSGLPSGLWLYGSADSRDEALSQVLEQDLRRPPGEAPEYSDLGMMVLAEIIESVSGERLDRFLASRVFVPLGITSTMFLPPFNLRDRIIPTALDTERPYPLHGVVHDANAFRLQGVAGHAGLFSTARDLAIFSQMMLNGGRFERVRVIADSTVARLVTRQEGAEERALGWDTPAERSSAGRFFSARSYGHTGYTGTSIWIDPERDLFVVLLTNRTYTSASASAILDLRISVHEAVARAITDQPISRRPGAR